MAVAMDLGDRGTRCSGVDNPDDVYGNRACFISSRSHLGKRCCFLACSFLGVLFTAIATFCVFYFYGAGMGIITSICSLGLIFAIATLGKVGETYRYIRDHRS